MPRRNKQKFPNGSQHPHFKKGWTVTKSGYVRITSGPNRNKYVHRLAVERLLGKTLPTTKEVHHIDFVRHHNCCPNLLVLDAALHSAITVSGRRRTSGGLFESKGLSGSEIIPVVPEWMLQELPCDRSIPAEEPQEQDVPDWVTKEESWQGSWAEEGAREREPDLRD